MVNGPHLHLCHPYYTHWPEVSMLKKYTSLIRRLIYFLVTHNVTNKHAYARSLTRTHRMHALTLTHTTHTKHTCTRGMHAHALHTHTRMRTHTTLHTHIRMHALTHSLTNTKHTCTRARNTTHTFAHARTHTLARSLSLTHTHTYTHVHARSYIHTHTHMVATSSSKSLLFIWMACGHPDRWNLSYKHLHGWAFTKVHNS